MNVVIIIHKLHNYIHPLLMGDINFELAKMADNVVEVIGGIPVYYKRGEENV